LITVSIVTHGHGRMVLTLVDRLLEFTEVSRIILTVNVPEAFYSISNMPERLVIIDNQIPKGFGANHNNAFNQCDTPFFCVLNPDVELPKNPFYTLIKLMEALNADLVAPAVKTRLGYIEDSARHFPTLISIIVRVMGGYDGRYPIKFGDPPFRPDWIAGMFMLFRSEIYQKLCGFDERFYLYYEDVDICRRAKHHGHLVLCCPQVFIVHSAQRASRFKLQHFYWHIKSMFLFLFFSN